MGYYMRSRGRVSWLLLGLLLALSMPVPTGSQEYTIGPGDVLTITVWGQPDLSADYIVYPDGFAPFPLIGRVKASGLTSQQVATTLAGLLGKDYLVDPQVIVAVKSYLSQKVTILGEATRPGVFYLAGPTTLVDILSQAGGISKDAGKEILLVRDQRQAESATRDGNSGVQRLNIERIHAGSAAENLRVQAGDTIFVATKPPENKDVIVSYYVFGEVRKPGAYPLDKETNVLEGITIAGGFTEKASPSRTRVIRMGPSGQQVVEVDMNDIIKRGRREKAIPLQANDVVVVPESFF